MKKKRPNNQWTIRNTQDENRYLEFVWFYLHAKCRVARVVTDGEYRGGLLTVMELGMMGVSGEIWWCFSVV